MKRFIIERLTEITAWIGFAVIIFSLLGVYTVMFWFGVLLVIVDDKSVQKWCGDKAPKIKQWLDEL